MKIIKAFTVRKWGASHPDAATGLEGWLKAVRHANWTSFTDLRATYRSADLVKVKSGRSVMVFNIKGNSYRLIAAVHFNQRLIYTLRFMTHAEYSKDKWKETL